MPTKQDASLSFVMRVCEAWECMSKETSSKAIMNLIEWESRWSKVDVSIYIMKSWETIEFDDI